LSDFAPHLFVNYVLFKIIVKRGERGQNRSKKIKGVAKLHNWQKDRGKNAIKHKKFHLTRKGAKR